MLCLLRILVYLELSLDWSNFCCMEDNITSKSSACLTYTLCYDDSNHEIKNTNKSDKF